MQITRDVILDLLPLYCAGEVTVDTRTLVEEFLRQDPSLATQAAEIRRALRTVEVIAPMRRSGDADLRALRRVRGAVRWRGALLGTSIFLTCLLFSFTFDKSGVHWTWLGMPLFTSINAGLAVVSWVFYLYLRRRLGV